ncbi:AMP-binding protein [Nocardioides convexus]|uniref:class I adenylate-forming enzyme family protein n=1 Tax=Nocardioides convexus TaxID=2712224 RepID=UPI0024187320|nr:AMP-binding protein [Nocardioides convexus]
MIVASLPATRAAAAPDAPALRDDELELDNAGLDAAVTAAAARLRDAGVGRGDVVGLLLPNRAALIIALLASWRLGAAVTPINPVLTGAEVTHQATDAGAKVLVTGDGGSPVGGIAGIGVDELGIGGPAPADPPPAVDVAPTDLALLIYTAGTTGKPKGVMTTHGNIDAMTGSFIEHFSFTAEDHSLLVLPLFHANGVVLGTLTPLRAGGQATIVGRFKADTFFAAVEKHRPTYFSAVPAIYAMLTALPADVQPDTRLAAAGHLRGGADAGGAHRQVRAPVRRTAGRGLRPLRDHHRLVDQPGRGPAQAGDGGHGAARPGDQDRRRERCRRRPGRAGRGADQGPGGHAGLPQPARGHRQGAGRRVAAHRRRGPVRRGRLPGAGRPGEGHDHPRWGEHLPQGDRGRDLREPRRLRGGRGRPAARRLR